MNKEVCYRHSMGFHSVGKQLLQVREGTLFLGYCFSPCVVNLAFSCELSLKLIYYAETNEESKRGHYLKKLYNDLSLQSKTMIQNEYNSRINDYSSHGPAMPFDQCLAIHDYNFVDFRYLHEPNHEGKSAEPRSLLILAESLLEIAQRYK